ncbi:hypothetical protein DDE19_20185 [Micromonospora ureilytica]|uniref:Uncharacterized protein n=1 Tax=Micromonospora ureilytica TaxID=709868 RepID=A0A3N9XR11_9ACTN|nr:hypothetical protein DDE19_20185 [Micromonospora ureilytica]
MIGYTVPEIRRLLTALIVRSTHPPEHVWAWSRWRRRRQHQARTCHYRRHGYPGPTAVAVLRAILAVFLRGVDNVDLVAADPAQPWDQKVDLVGGRAVSD